MIKHVSFLELLLTSYIEYCFRSHLININGKDREERMDASQDKDICLLNVEVVKMPCFQKMPTFIIDHFLERRKERWPGTQLSWVNSKVGSELCKEHLIPVNLIICFNIFTNENVQHYLDRKRGKVLESRIEWTLCFTCYVLCRNQLRLFIIFRSKQAGNQAVRIDEGCRFMFPLAFLSFNGVYW